MPQFGVRYAEGLKILPILANTDIVATATATQYVDLDKINWATFFVQFGNIASTDSTGEVVVTIEASTAATSNATEGQVLFQYRLSGAVATDSMGAITTPASAAAGAPVNNTDDNKVLIIDIDPSIVAASAADRRYIRAVITPTAEITATAVSAVAVLEPRYIGNAIPSST